MTTEEPMLRILYNLIIGILFIGILYEGWKAINIDNIIDPDRPVPVKKAGFDLFFLFGISYLLLVAFIIVVPTQTITENVKVAYTEKETYFTQEPYTVEEPYSVQETYSVQEPIQNTGASYTTIDAPGMTNWISGSEISGSHFETDEDGLTSDGCKCSVWGLDQKHNPRQVCYQKKCAVGNSAINYRTVQQSRTVQKFRTVTKYKDVPHIRDVAKTRIEPRQVEVNWILGFKTPWKIHL